MADATYATPGEVAAVLAILRDLVTRMPVATLVEAERLWAVATRAGDEIAAVHSVEPSQASGTDSLRRGHNLPTLAKGNEK